LPQTVTSARRAGAGDSIRSLLEGELDLTAREAFESAPAGALDDSDRIVADLAAPTLLDWSARSVIFTAAERSRDDGALMILVSPRGQVRRLLDLVGAPAGVAVLDHDDLPTDRTLVRV
jgi:anti-anti-sigma regulatory factor